MKHKQLLWILFLVVLAVLLLQRHRTITEFNGTTMGTTYLFKVVLPVGVQPSVVQWEINQCLSEFEGSMSTYDKTSEISRFNGLRSLEAIDISPLFYEVMSASFYYYELSDYAWDPTIKPLLDLWRFSEVRDSLGLLSDVPSYDDISTVKKSVGLNQLQLNYPHFLQKSNLDVHLDLSSIAKGYAVDKLKDVLVSYGASAGLLEIGGEMAAWGYKPSGKEWRIGINTPDYEASRSEVYTAVSLTNQALATSGDYRNYIELNSKRYSHIIDPRTGYPVTHSVASVSVRAPTCMMADALATALMVLGPDEGLAIINRLPDVEALFFIRREGQAFGVVFSDGWE